MRITHNKSGPIAHIYGLVKVAIVVSMFYQFGWIAGIMAIFLVVEVKD